MSISAQIGKIEQVEDGLLLTLAEVPGQITGQDYQTITDAVVHPIAVGDLIWGGGSNVIIVHQDGVQSWYCRSGYTTLNNGHIVSGTRSD